LVGEQFCHDGTIFYTESGARTVMGAGCVSGVTQNGYSAFVEC
jgi:hypothetical protein